MVSQTHKSSDCHFSNVAHGHVFIIPRSYPKTAKTIHICLLLNLLLEGWKKDVVYVCYYKDSGPAVAGSGLDL